MTGVSIPVFSVNQPIGQFFVGVIRADALLSICKFGGSTKLYHLLVDQTGVQT
jgi:hypothetical protein